MNFAVYATSWIWLALEVGLRVRDRITRRGSTGRDRATRRTIMLMIVPAILAATAVGYLVPVHSPLRLPGAGSGPGAGPVVGLVPWPVAAGLAVMWLGLIVRTWAIVVLGRSFRTTVEIDADQPVVQRGPYRWVRHPAYTGVLLLAAGYGLAMGSWLSLLITVTIPAVAMLRRIGVEESALVETLGRPYEIYRTHTKLLVPGLW
jgi:protein-S-isoprenylcysteine O-methyltransferase Ste14